MKKYDKAGKYILDEFSLDIIKFFTGIEPKNIEILDKELNVPAKYVDSAFKIDDKYIFNLEIQTKYKNDIYFRMLLYNVALSYKYNLPVHTMVIFLKKDQEAKITSNYTREVLTTKISFNFEVVKIWEIESEELLNSNLLGLMPLVPLTKKDENLIKICHDRIVSSNLDEKIKLDLLGSLEGLSGLFYKKEVIKKMLSYEKLKDSVTVQEWYNQGKDQGKKEEAVNLLLKLLNKKFKKLPKDVVETVSSIQSIETVEKVIEKIFEIKTVKELKEILK